MKKLLYILLSVSGFYLQAQDVSSRPFVLRHAYFAIAGETNVNDFSCRLVKQNLTDTLYISGNWEGLSLDINGLKFELPTHEFDCGMRLMTNDFQKLLKADQYENVLLEIDQLHLTDDYNLDSLENVKSETLIQITDQNRTETIESGYLRKYQGQFILGGAHKIKMTRYNIEPPTKFFGTVRARDELYIEFEVIFESIK